MQHTIAKLPRGIGRATHHCCMASFQRFALTAGINCRHAPLCVWATRAAKSHASTDTSIIRHPSEGLRKGNAPPVQRPRPLALRAEDLDIGHGRCLCAAGRCYDDDDQVEDDGDNDSIQFFNCTLRPEVDRCFAAKQKKRGDAPQNNYIQRPQDKSARGLSCLRCPQKRQAQHPERGPSRRR